MVKAKDIPTPLRPYWSFRDGLSVEESLVMKGGRILIPNTMRNEILNKIRASHQGIEKRILRAQKCVYWPGINEDIKKMVKGCLTWQKYQTEKKKETIIPHKIPSRSWKVIGIDLFHVAGETYLLVANYHSKFPFIRKMHTQDYTCFEIHIWRTQYTRMYYKW